MKRFQKMTTGVLYALLCVVIFSGCDGSKYDGLILTDRNTGREYLLKHNILDTYFIDEKAVKIIGNDTTLVFE